MIQECFFSRVMSRVRAKHAPSRGLNVEGKLACTEAFGSLEGEGCVYTHAFGEYRESHK